jgi:hypothetical protein
MLLSISRYVMCLGKAGFVFGAGGRQNQQQQQQQGLPQKDDEDNKWEEGLVMLMSTIIVDKDRAGAANMQKKRPGL